MNLTIVCLLYTLIKKFVNAGNNHLAGGLLDCTGGATLGPNWAVARP
jgi:hypothetical protein